MHNRIEEDDDVISLALERSRGEVGEKIDPYQWLRWNDMLYSVIY